MNPQDISIKNLSEYLNYLITEFYDNNLQPFFDAIDEDVVWVGPMHNQYLRGKEAAVNAFSAESGGIEYTIGTILTELIPHGRAQCDTVSFFHRKAIFPNGDVMDSNLCFHLSWIKKDSWYMSVISIMLRLPGDERDKVYPRHRDSYKTAPWIAPEKQIARLMIREKNTGGAIYIAMHDIIWVESAKHYCVIHTVDAEFTAASDIGRLAEMTEGSLLRCHSGYLVNPIYVRSIERFRITLEGGKTVPVPEKKYTAVKTKLTEMIP